MNQSQSNAWPGENVEISRNPDGGSPNDSSEVGCPHPPSCQGPGWVLDLPKQARQMCNQAEMAKRRENVPRFN